MEICAGCDKVLDEVRKLKDEFEHESRDTAVQIAKFEGEKKELISMTKSMHKRLDDSNKRFEEHMRTEEDQREEQTEAIHSLSTNIKVYAATNNESLKWMKIIAYVFGVGVLGILGYLFLELTDTQRTLNDEISNGKYYESNRDTIVEIIERYKLDKKDPK